MKYSVEEQSGYKLFVNIEIHCCKDYLGMLY